jgi:hypothetical protein
VVQRYSLFFIEVIKAGRFDIISGMQVCERSLRPVEDTGKTYFEKNWGAFLTGEIYPWLSAEQVTDRHQRPALSAQQ